MKKTSSAGLSTPGACTLLVIFAVLCIYIFAILSLSETLAGGRLADATASSISNYYSADSEAEAVLSELRSGKVPESVINTDGIYSYSCPISDTSAIEVEVKIDDDSYEILKWQQVYTAAWEPDESIEVWNRN